LGERRKVRLFGTDGVRGVAGSELTCSLAFDLGRAGAHVIARVKKQPLVVVGRDTRISGGMLEMALAAGLCSVGAKVLLCGVLPTPAVAYLIRKYGADAGAVISASHNPMQYNGIKFFDGRGYKLPDAVEDEIQSVIEGGCSSVPSPTGEWVGTCSDISLQAQRDYIDFLKTIPAADLGGLKVVMDCANGASSVVTPAAFRELGAEVTVINNQPDGLNINRDCGSLHLEGLKAAVIENGADIGLAFDGDADRMLAVDELGNTVDGDKIMLICADDMKQKGQLKDDTLVVTVMSNFGLVKAAQRLGIKLETTAVGDRYVLERMLQRGYVIGGEQSGHVIFLRENTTGDGAVSALKLCSILAGSGKTLSRHAEIMSVMPQVLVNVRLAAEKKPLWKQDGEIQAAIEELEHKYSGKGRLLVRESGTEPLVRVMLEGDDQAEIERDANSLAQLIRERMA